MTKLEKMEQAVFDKKILQLEMPLESSPSIAAKSDGQAVIVLDRNQMNTSKEVLVALTHELSHIEEGCLYRHGTPFECAGKMERRAWKSTVEHLVSKGDLVNAIRKTDDDLWEVAEMLDVTVDLVARACHFYLGVELEAIHARLGLCSE